MKNKSKKGLFAIVVIFLVLIGNQAISQNQIVGQIAYGGDQEFPLSNVDVELYDLQNTLVLSTLTNGSGFYTFNNVPSGEYYVRALSNNEGDDVIDLDDAYFIMLYLYGMNELDEIQFQAADVDNSGTVNWSDYMLIVVNYLLYEEPLPAGTWQFEEEYVNLTARSSEDTIVKWGIMEGDVFVDWETSGRSNTDVIGDYTPVQLKNEQIEVFVESDYNENIGGFDLNFQYPTNLISVIDIEGPDDKLNYSIDENTGELHVIWINENDQYVNENQLIKLTVEPRNQNINAEGLLTLLPGSLLLNEKGVKLEDAEITLPQFKQTQLFEFEVSTYPNPVVNQLNIDLTMPEANTAELMVFDLQGRLIERQENINLTEGNQLIAIDAQQYMPGHYLYVFKMLEGTQETIQGRFYRSH